MAHYAAAMRLLLSTLILVSCHGPIGGYCADLEDCTGSDRRACEQALREDASRSREVDCGREWQVWARCLAQDSVCEGAIYAPLSEECSVALFDWQDCLLPMQ